MTVDESPRVQSTRFSGEPSSRTVPLGVEVGDLDLVGDLDQRRRDAVRAALEQALGRAAGVWSADDPASWGPAAGLCRYGPGCVALALAGRTDRAGLEGLRALAAELPRLAATELTIDLSRLQGCEPALAWVLGRLRRERLAAGARVELHHAPRELVAELGEHPAPPAITWSP